MANKEDRSANTLGPFLATLRASKGWTLREVEEATEKEVSNAYLSQLENGKISKPSPHILHSLAQVYGMAYEILMEKAGYIVRSSPDQQRHGRLPTSAIENLTDEENEHSSHFSRYIEPRRKDETRRPHAG